MSTGFKEVVIDENRWRLWRIFETGSEAIDTILLTLISVAR